MTSGSAWFKVSFWEKFLEKTAVEDEIEYLLKECTVSDFSRVDGEFETAIKRHIHRWNFTTNFLLKSILELMNHDW